MKTLMQFVCALLLVALLTACSSTATAPSHAPAAPAPAPTTPDQTEGATKAVISDYFTALVAKD